jgi:hypothetical protein
MGGQGVDAHHILPRRYGVRGTRPIGFVGRWRRSRIESMPEGCGSTDLQVAPASHSLRPPTAASGDCHAARDLPPARSSARCGSTATALASASHSLRPPTAASGDCHAARDLPPARSSARCGSTDLQVAPASHSLRPPTAASGDCHAARDLPPARRTVERWGMARGRVKGAERNSLPRSTGGLGGSRRRGTRVGCRRDPPQWMVPKAGLEPAWLAPHAPQTCASTNSATSARLILFSLLTSAGARGSLAHPEPVLARPALPARAWLARLPGPYP